MNCPIFASQPRPVTRLWFGFFMLIAGLILLTPAHAQTDSKQFIIKLKNSVELSAQPSVRTLEREGASLHEVMQRNNVDAQWLRAGSVGTHVMRWGVSVRHSDQQALLNRLASDPEVEFAIEDRPMRAFATPNDPNFLNQWALRSTSNTAGAKFDRAWDVVKGSSSVVVAVLDTGVVYETPDLQGRLLSGYDFISDVATANDGNGRDANAADPGNWITSSESASGPFAGCTVRDSSWHGTFVAGQIAANTNSDSDVSGADWNVKVLPVRVLGKCGGLLSDVLDAMLWSAGLDVPGVPRNPNPASVINLSLGSSTTCSAFEQTVVDRVNAAGALIVAAAGNSSGAVDSPANCNNVMSIGALDRDGSRASYSAIGSGVDMMAPGGFSNGLVGLGNSGRTGPGAPGLISKTGTSFSAPLVAATAGLMKAINPALGPSQLRAQILGSAAPFLSPRSSACVVNQGGGSCNCTSATCGAGMLDAFAAVQSARGTRPVANASSSANGLTSSGFQESAAGLNPVRLRGSASSVAAGRTVASYLWEQVSGEQVMVGTRSTADVDLPPSTSTSDLVFRLTVTDSVGESHSVFTALRVVASGDSGSAPSNAATGAGSTTPPASDNGSGSTPASSPAPAASGGGGGGGLNLAGLLGLALLMLVFKRIRPVSSLSVS